MLERVARFAIAMATRTFFVHLSALERTGLGESSRAERIHRQLSISTEVRKQRKRTG